MHATKNYFHLITFLGGGGGRHENVAIGFLKRCFRIFMGSSKIAKTNVKKGFKTPTSVSQSTSHNETVSLRQPQEGSISEVVSLS